jgi:hypothetical protein
VTRVVVYTTALLVSNGIADARHGWATSVNLRHHGERKLADLLLAELTSRLAWPQVRGAIRARLRSPFWTPSNGKLEDHCRSGGTVEKSFIASGGVCKPGSVSKVVRKVGARGYSTDWHSQAALELLPRP